MPRMPQGFKGLLVTGLSNYLTVRPLRRDQHRCPPPHRDPRQPLESLLEPLTTEPAGDSVKLRKLSPDNGAAAASTDDDYVICVRARLLRAKSYASLSTSSPLPSTPFAVHTYTHRIALPTPTGWGMERLPS